MRYNTYALRVINIVALLTLLLGALVGTRAEAAAPATLSMYNNTEKEVFAAIVAFDQPTNGWVSKGWYKIAPYSQFDYPLGRYSGTVYVHGHRSGFLTDSSWGRGYSFCVNQGDAFTIRDADKVNCKDRASFSAVVVTPGQNSFKFNP